MKNSCPIWISHVQFEWVSIPIRQQVWRSHALYEKVMSHINELCPIWKSHVPYEWVMSHMNKSRWLIWMSLDSNPCPIWETRHDSFIWDMTHLYGTWLFRVGQFSCEWVSIPIRQRACVSVSCVCIRAHVYLCLVCVYARMCICVWCVCTRACVSVSCVCVRAHVCLCVCVSVGIVCV